MPKVLCTQEANMGFMEAGTRESRLFVSYASPDTDLANAFINFLRLGCDLRERQVFSTARPGALPPGIQFVEAIREALDTADMAVLLLTPSYYESRFCLAEAGATWVQNKAHIPVLVPPINYHDLEGVQLGEQAVKIDSSSDLDDVRDSIRDVLGVSVPTGAWNSHKEDFLNLWAARFDGAIAPARSVPAPEYEEVVGVRDALQKESSDLTQDRDRLRKFTRELATQNEQLRARVPEAPAAPQMEGDETAQAIAEAESAIEVAQNHLKELPDIVRESLFQYYHDGRPVTVGGLTDRFATDTARVNVEQGYLSWVEDEPQTVTPRHQQPQVDNAESALRSVRDIVFSGQSFESRSEAADWIRPLLKDKYGIQDPTFELRPVWQALGFL
jgi:hypothetical protein